MYVCRLVGCTVKFLRTAFPGFKVRGHGSRKEREHGGLRKWMHVGSNVTYIALEQRNCGSDEKLENPILRRHYSDPGINHVAFVVPEVQPIIDRLVAAGYKEGIAVPKHDHRKRVYFWDNQGNEFEFVEYFSRKFKERNQYENQKQKQKE